jgi:hypothetical protein
LSGPRKAHHILQMLRNRSSERAELWTGVAGSERKAIPSPHHHRLLKAGFIGSGARLTLGQAKWLLSIHIRTFCSIFTAWEEGGCGDERLFRYAFRRSQTQPAGEGKACAISIMRRASGAGSQSHAYLPTLHCGFHIGMPAV